MDMCFLGAVLSGICACALSGIVQGEKGISEERDLTNALNRQSLDASILNRFQGQTQPALREFFQKIPKLQAVQKVFYPFGGADILYPLEIFPNATQILLVGLEAIHFVPSMDLTQSFQQDPISRDVLSLMKKSFSVSQEMWDHEEDLQEGVFKRMCDQLRILGVREMTATFDPIAQLLTLQFVYRSLPRTILYKQRSLKNRYDSDVMLDWMHKQGIEGVVLKATSYTLHQPEFSKIRAFLQKEAQVIVQDDSGIPLKALSITHKVHKFGSYTKPYGSEWTAYVQPDLREKKAEEGGALNFFFGYGGGKKPSMVLVAFLKSSQKSPRPSPSPAL